MWVGRVCPVWAHRLRTVVYKIYAMRDRSVAVASQGGLAGGMVTTHPQGSLGSHNLIGGEDVRVPLSLP
jgi:hypothetical protein